MIIEENWKEYPGNSDYLISSFGRVFRISTDNFIKGWIHKSRAGFYKRFKIGTKKIMGHVLVGETFLIRPHLDCTQVDHLDGNALNNNLSNLEWVTQPINIKRMYRLGVKPIARKICYDD